MEDTATTDMEKGEVFKNFFASVFTSKKPSCTKQYPKQGTGIRSNSNHLGNINILKSVGYE